MVRIGFANFDMSTRGGAQQVLCNIANALRMEGKGEYEVHIISFIHEKESCAYSLRPGIQYVNLLPYKGRIRDVVLRAGRAFRKYCREQEIQLLFYVGATTTRGTV